jgi:hypothetical protein
MSLIKVIERMSDTLGDSVKQWLRYPQEFRIAVPKSLDLSESLEEMTTSLEFPAVKVQTISEKEEELLDMAVDVGTLVWRIQKRLAAIGELPKQLQRVSRDVESTWDALTQRGIEIKDHTGRDYDGGMTLRVVTSQPVAGLARQQIIETLKPTIYYRERIIQMGEVIVGVPEETETSKPAQGTT